MTSPLSSGPAPARPTALMSTRGFRHLDEMAERHRYRLQDPRSLPTVVGRPASDRQGELLRLCPRSEDHIPSQTGLLTAERLFARPCRWRQPDLDIQRSNHDPSGWKLTGFKVVRWLPGDVTGLVWSKAVTPGMDPISAASRILWTTFQKHNGCPGSSGSTGSLPTTTCWRAIVLTTNPGQGCHPHVHSAGAAGPEKRPGDRFQRFRWLRTPGATQVG